MRGDDDAHTIVSFRCPKVHVLRNNGRGHLRRARVDGVHTSSLEPVRCIGKDQQSDSNRCLGPTSERAAIS